MLIDVIPPKTEEETEREIEMYVGRREAAMISEFVERASIGVIKISTRSMFFCIVSKGYLCLTNITYCFQRANCSEHIPHILPKPHKRRERIRNVEAVFEKSLIRSALLRPLLPPRLSDTSSLASAKEEDPAAEGLFYTPEGAIPICRINSSRPNGALDQYFLLVLYWLQIEY